jgi:hypothetical protein
MRRKAFMSAVISLIALAGASLIHARRSLYSVGQTPPSRPSQPPNSSTAYVRLKMVRIVDNAGLSEPAEVMTMLIPADWKFEGHVKWHPENSSCPDSENLSSITFRAASPDGLLSFERFPNTFWMWITNSIAADPPCPLHEPVSAETYVTDQLLPEVRSGARVLSAQPEREMSRITTELVRRGNATAIGLGHYVTLQADCTRVTYEYRIDGHTVQESMLGTLITMSNRRPANFSGKGNSGKSSEYYSVHASDFYASRTPQEQAEPNGIIFARILISSRANPRWIAGRKEIVSRLRHDPEHPDGALPRGKLPEMTGQQVADAYRRQAEARMPHAKAYDPSVLPLETFIDSRTSETVELNGGFEFAWSNNFDEYILTNDSKFSPAVEFKEDWVPLRHAAPPQH